jgi:hypothetical protein
MQSLRLPVIVLHAWVTANYKQIALSASATKRLPLPKLLTSCSVNYFGFGQKQGATQAKLPE